MANNKDSTSWATCLDLESKLSLRSRVNNEKGVDEINLGEVNIENYRTSHFYLINPTTVPARWTLNYVKFPMKETLGYMTKTPLEIENLKKTDDPDVFQFYVTEVIIISKIIGMPKRTEHAAQNHSRGLSLAFSAS